MAGGDGSLITTIMKARDLGVDISKLICVSLPYGTGNDFCNVTNWGTTPNLPFYMDTSALVKEICLNTHEQTFDVWDVLVKF
jgi:hypothetical protein